MKRINFPSALFVLSALTVLAIGFWTRASLPITREFGRVLGMTIFLLGMTLFAWAGICLSRAFYGSVEPVTDHLITQGPYARIRHPLYLSALISLIGLCLSLRSLWGIVWVFILFLPALIFRAILEEEALENMHGTGWFEFKSRTCFLVPFLW